MVRIYVDSALSIPVEELSEEVEADIQAEFTHANPAYHKAKRYSKWGGREPRSIATWSHTIRGEKRCIVVPRGGARRVRRILKAAGIEWCFVDEREQGAPDACHRIPKHEPAGYDNPGELLWPHQQAIPDAVAERQNCLVRAPTGSGKTTAAIATIERVQLPTLVMVYDSALLRQWQDRLKRELNLRESDIGQIGDGKFHLAPVTMGMQQSLMRMDRERWEQVNGYFGMLVCDEVQRAAAASFVPVIGRTRAKYRVGISADETRKDQKEFLIYDLFGDVAVEVQFEELVEAGFVHDVKVRIVPTEFEAPWYNAQRDAMMKGGEETPNFNRFLDEMTTNDARNALAARIALDEVKAGHQVVLFSQRREHCSVLNRYAASAGIKSGLMLGGSESKDEFKNAIAALKRGELRWAAGTLQACGQGLDIPSVSRGIVTTPIAFNRQWFGQVRGRMCRASKGKVDAVLYYLWDRKVYGLAPVKNLVKWNNFVEVFDDGGVWIEGEDFISRVRKRGGYSGTEDEESGIDGDGRLGAIFIGASGRR